MVVIRKNNFKFFQAQIILLNRSHFFTEFDFGYTRRNLLKKTVMGAFRNAGGLSHRLVFISERSEIKKKIFVLLNFFYNL